MKQKTFLKGIVALLLVITLVGCTPVQQQDSSKSIVGDNLRVAEVELPGMFCASCAKSSKSAFEGIDGVVQATIDFKTKKGTVIYDPSVVSKEQLLQDGLLQAYDCKIINDKPFTQ